MTLEDKLHIEKMNSIAGVNKLLAIVKKLDDAGREELLKALATELTPTKKATVMNLIKSQAALADKDIKDWLVNGISTVYVAGMNDTVQQLKDIKFKPPVEGMPLVKITPEMLLTVPLMKPHLEAVNVLLSDAYLNFGNTMTGYVKGAERILNDTIKKQVRSTIAMGRLEGTSVADIKKNVKKAFTDTGFTVLVDRGGNKWELSQYAEMLTRTQLLSANNDGLINRAGNFNIDIVEVSDHSADCPICEPLEGEIFSISGNSDNYPALAEEPPFHPNCGHRLLMRPDLD